MTFARSVGDFGEDYSDAAFVETGLAGVAVPPTFVQAVAQFDPEYSLRPHPGRPWAGSPARGQDAPEQPMRTRSDPEQAKGKNVLHAEQRFDFVRPVRVGDVLTAKQHPGRSWDKQGRKGGRLVFSETITEYFDGAGQLVVTATAVAVAPDHMPGEAGTS